CARQNTLRVAGGAAADRGAGVGGPPYNPAPSAGATEAPIPRTRGLTVSLLPSASRRAQAGAVNTLWVIILLVALLGTLGLWYATASNASSLEGDLAALKAERTKQDSHLTDQSKEIGDLAGLVGYHDEASVGSRPDPVAVQADIDAVKASLKESLGGPDTKVTLQQTIAALRSALTSSQAAATQAKSDLDAE